MRISDWSSDVCSSDLADGDLMGESWAREDGDPGAGLRFVGDIVHQLHRRLLHALGAEDERLVPAAEAAEDGAHVLGGRDDEQSVAAGKIGQISGGPDRGVERIAGEEGRSEEHTSELQSLM